MSAIKISLMNPKTYDGYFIHVRHVDGSGESIGPLDKEDLIKIRGRIDKELKIIDTPTSSD